jgi:PAS domain S-box-containing protein
LADASPPDLTFARDRIQTLLDRLEVLASGDTVDALPISPLHDELDAIAHGVNVLVGELRWAHALRTEIERVRAEQVREEQVRIADARFATAFRSNPCAMAILVLADWRFRNVNESFETSSGYTSNEIVGRTLAEIGMWVHPDDVATMRMELETAGSFRSREVRYENKNGVQLTTVCSAEIMSFDGELCVLCAAMDITDRKRAEVQVAMLQEELAHLDRVKSLDALAGSLAHEINQPLTAVMANAEAALRLLAAREPRLEAVREALAEIVADNRHAGEVILRMRSLLKKSPARVEEIDLNSLVNDVVRLVQGNAARRHIMLDVDLGCEIAPLPGDRIQIQQLVLNLLLNALDATQEQCSDAARVRVRTSQRDDMAVVDVTDHGTGASDEVLARMFEPFYTTKSDGMGIGLSICRTIVTAHKGTLAATRNGAGGMTFSAAFPTCAAPDPRVSRVPVPGNVAEPM